MHFHNAATFDAIGCEFFAGGISTLVGFDLSNEVIPRMAMRGCETKSRSFWKNSALPIRKSLGGRSCCAIEELRINGENCLQPRNIVSVVSFAKSLHGG